MPEAVLSSKGQVVLPREIRETLGLREGDRLRVEIEDDHITIRPIRSSNVQDWRRWRGVLAGTTALADHLAEHSEEVTDERLP
ncbi:MAG: AbrB/MazE/SpoVT family DNA-binding domain-containing protein [Deltaproteobacteria bacterium]|nr:AbrB/MazE/SpoVT family DNA-binding domain-containing protein [Deltaproteobacteria bacterium]MBW2071528.1 AbrB/MazE/SpoVT family DNA-binding domain-containing protein [Deltaproteobacteria bacterium]